MYDVNEVGMIPLNVNALNYCLQATAKWDTDDTQEFTRYVCIQDVDDGRYYKRHYIGTNGYILIHCEENIRKTRMIFTEPVFLDYGFKKIRQGAVYIDLTKANEAFGIVGEADIDAEVSRVVVNLWDVDLLSLIPKTGKKAKDYVMFNPTYTKILEKMGLICTIPYAENGKAPHVWTTDDGELIIDVLLMPLRISDY